MAVDLNLVRHALTVARKAELVSVELEGPNLRFSAELGRITRPSLPSTAVAAPAASEGTEVRSPLVGYFGFGAKRFKVGDVLARGDVIGVVTALGIPSEVVSNAAGAVDQILVAEGDPVQYGQPILKVKAE